MSLITLDELRNAVGKSPSDRVLMDRIAGVSAAIERYCNRAFAKRVSGVAVDTAGVLSLTIPRHGIEPGATIVVKTSTGVSALDGNRTALTTGRTEHVLTIASALTENDLEGVEITVRQRRELIRPTRGGRTLFLDPLPIAEVNAVSLADGSGGWEALESTGYSLSETRDGLSLIGELMLTDRYFLTSVSGGVYPSGAKVTFVSGAAWVQSDIAQACLAVCKTIDKRQRSAGLSSERYDYYSYTRLGSAELKELFGEVESTLIHYRITAV